MTLRRFKPLGMLLIVILMFAIGIGVSAWNMYDCSKKGGVFTGAFTKMQHCVERR